MAEVTAIPASSVILLRNAAGDASFEVLMIRRHQTASFVPDAWVFPGGAVDAADHDVAKSISRDATADVMKIAAIRELFEETGIWLGTPLTDQRVKQHALLDGSIGISSLLDESPVDLDLLVWTSRWITPEGVPKRFDTWFFLAAAPPDATPNIAIEEAADVAWITPQEAIATLKMVFPTIRNLEAIRGFRSVAELIDSRRGADIQPVQPRIVGGKPVLP